MHRKPKSGRTPKATERKQRALVLVKADPTKTASDVRKHASDVFGVRRLPEGRKLRLPGWFKLNNVTLLRTPPMSSDLSPIENLWYVVKRKITGRHF